jgi:hypothetical protein
MIGRKTKSVSITKKSKRVENKDVTDAFKIKVRERFCEKRADENQDLR